MNPLRALLAGVVVMMTIPGCQSVVRHSFDGLGTAGNPDHPLTLSSGQFHKSDEAWHFKTTSSQQYPTTTDWPYAFGLHCKATDFELLEFTVRDDKGNVLPFVKLSPAIEDYGDPGTMVILAPEDSVTTKNVLTTGIYHIEVTYQASRALHQAAWTIAHRKNRNIEAWERPKS